MNNLIVLFLGFSCGSHERRLLNDLMTTYQKLERSVFEEFTLESDLSNVSYRGAEL